MNDPFDELEHRLAGLAEHAPTGVSRVEVARRVAAHRRRRAIVRIGSAVACVGVVTGGVVTIAGRSPGGSSTAGSSSTIGAVTTLTAPATVPPSFPVADPQALNFLVVGDDSHACVAPNSPWAGAADPGRGEASRTDTIMVMRLEPATRRAAVLSFPRDLWVEIPGRGDGRINSAYTKNDPSLLAQTIYDNFGVVVDHYLQIDFCAFTRIVDAVGGVAVPFATPVRDRNVDLDITAAGCHTFTGDEALAYVRSRHLEWIDEEGEAHADESNDLGRIARQQDFLRRMLGTALASGLFDPSIARSLIEALQTDIVTDRGLTIDDLLSFVGVLKDIDPADIPQYQIETSALTVGGNSVLEPQIDGAEMNAALAIFRNDAPISDAPDHDAATGASDLDEGSTSVMSPSAPLNGGIVPDPNIECWGSEA
jgi:LCP family protein required for cell wall assembly